MALESRLELKLQQKLVLTPQLQLAIRLLQMPQLELQQAITQELVENPFLEESLEGSSSEEGPTAEEAEPTDSYEGRDDTELPLESLPSFTMEDYFEERSYDGKDLGYFTPGTETQPTFENFVGTPTDLMDHLLWQLRLSREDEDVRKLAETIIGNLDENGYLKLGVDEFQELAGVDSDKIEAALRLIHGFDPPGVGARDLRECLHIQLRHLNLEDSLPWELVDSGLELLGKRKYAQLAAKHGVTVDEIMTAVKVIEGLEPKPGRNFTSVTANYIVPDVYLVKNETGYQIILNDEGMPRLRINSYYQRLLSNRDAVPKEDRRFLEDKLRSAVWLMKSLDQRNKTIYRVTECILAFQKDFFEKGVNSLNPLNLKDIAAELNLHESTISRVTSNKYLACPRGIYGFRFFFSNAIQSDGGEISATSVKEMVKKIVSEEDSSRPLSDMRIVEIFKSQNVTIARRTIAKYREELKIPPQSQRRRS